MFHTTETITARKTVTVVSNISDILEYIRFEVFTAVTTKNRVFLDVTPCGSCKNRRFGGTYASFIRVARICELETTLAVISNRRTLRRNIKLVFLGISSQRASVAYYS
jgi:hypothetical protein